MRDDHPITPAVTRALGSMFESGRRERDRLLDQLTERVKELTALHEVARLVQSDHSSIDELMRRLVALLPPAFQHPLATSVRIVFGAAEWQTPEWAAQPARALVATFRTEDGASGRIEASLAQPGDPFLPEEQQLLDSVADLLETRLNRWLAEAAQRATETKLRLLLDINRLIASQLTFESLLTVLSERLQRVVPHDHLGIALFDPESRAMRLEAWMAAGGSPVVNDARRLPIDGSLEGSAFQRNRPVVFRDAELRGLGAEGAPVLLAAGMLSACGLPLVTGRRAVGVLTVAARSAGAFSSSDVELLAQIAEQLALGVENALAFGELTGLRDRLAIEKQYLQEEIRITQDFGDIVARAPAMRRVLQLVESVAPTSSTVLLLGETGTGKELLARAVHNLSPRRGETFVRMNSASLPGPLFESELFGHEKGAFTGASSARVGRLELAHRGSIFLDEIGDLPIDLQVKLLRVLQEREFERLGGHRTVAVDVRVIAATNRDLLQMIAEGSFRSDLYYRLNVFPISVPPLRERREDIPLLVTQFVRRAAREMNRRPLTVPDATLDELMRWQWPGNIRELQHTIERAAILSPGDTLVIPAGTLAPAEPRRRSRTVDEGELDRQRQAIIAALKAARGVVAGPGGAAARLSLKRTTLLARMRRLGIDRGMT